MFVRVRRRQIMGYDERPSLTRFFAMQARLSSVISNPYAAHLIARDPAKYRRRHATPLNFDMGHLHASTQSMERILGPRLCRRSSTFELLEVVQCCPYRRGPSSRLEQYNQPAIDFRRGQGTVGAAEPGRF